MRATTSTSLIRRRSIKIGIHYPVLVMPATERLPLATYRHIEEFARRGGLVIAVKSLPSRAPGFDGGAAGFGGGRADLAEAVRDPAVKNVKVVASGPPMWARRSAQSSEARCGDDPGDAGGWVHPSQTARTRTFISSRIPTTGRMRSMRRFAPFNDSAEWWDPFTGKDHGGGTNGRTIHFDLAPYESRVVVFTYRRPQRAGASGRRCRSRPST